MLYEEDSLSDISRMKSTNKQKAAMFDKQQEEQRLNQVLKDGRNYGRNEALDAIESEMLKNQRPMNMYDEGLASSLHKEKPDANTQYSLNEFKMYNDILKRDDNRSSFSKLTPDLRKRVENLRDANSKKFMKNKAY